jgi:hypothetical protein
MRSYDPATGHLEFKICGICHEPFVEGERIFVAELESCKTDMTVVFHERCKKVLNKRFRCLEEGAE